MSAIDGVRWTNESAQKFLARGRWFGSLSPDMQERIVASSEIVHFAGGVNLFKIGEPASGLYATLIGDVRAYAYGDNNERIFLRAVGPGSWFGDAGDYQGMSIKVAVHKIGEFQDPSED